MILLFPISEGIIYVEDVRAYIHWNIEDLRTSNIKSMHISELMGDFGKIKPEYQYIEDLGFTNILDIPEFEDEIVRYVLSRVHGEFIWLDVLYKILKETIREITVLPQIGQCTEKKVSNDQVNKIIKATFDKRSMRVSTITDKNIRFRRMIIG